ANGRSGRIQMREAARNQAATYATVFASASTGELRSSVMIVWSRQSEWPQRQHFHSSRVVARHANRRASEMWDLSRVSGPPHRHVIMGAPPLRGIGASFGPVIRLRFHWGLGRFVPGGLATSRRAGDRPRHAAIGVWP